MRDANINLDFDILQRRRVESCAHATKIAEYNRVSKKGHIYVEDCIATSERAHCMLHLLIHEPKIVDSVAPY
jgi:hypothetical protein